MKKFKLSIVLLTHHLLGETEFSGTVLLLLFSFSSARSTKRATSKGRSVVVARCSKWRGSSEGTTAVAVSTTERRSTPATKRVLTATTATTSIIQLMREFTIIPKAALSLREEFARSFLRRIPPTHVVVVAKAVLVSVVVVAAVTSKTPRLIPKWCGSGRRRLSKRRRCGDTTTATERRRRRCCTRSKTTGSEGS